MRTLFLLIFLIPGVCFAGEEKERRVAVLQEIELNESKQWISMSETGTETGKPVLLFLHGGPGSANLGLLHELAPGLEEHAIVVNWDQRCSGKSSHLFCDTKRLHLEQLVADGHLLTQILKKKYHADKIILMGFSSGTVPGMHLIHRYPEDYSLYIGVAQTVDGKRGELLSLDYTLAKAGEAGDAKALKELQKIRFDFSRPETILEQTKKQRTYLLKYGGVYHTKESYDHESSSLWHSPLYSVLDFLFWPLGSARSLKAIWPEVVLTNFSESIPEVNVPLVFMSGVYDQNNPVSLVEEYYNLLQANRGKRLVLFENSAHAIFWDEPARFEAEVTLALQEVQNHRRIR